MTKPRAEPRKLPPPTAERVRELFDYDPETGALLWKKTVKNRQAGLPVSSSLLKDGYNRVGFDGTGWARHRVIWLYVHGYWPPAEIDHINGIRTDNRIANLRLADRSQNASNARTPKTNSSGYKGVSRHRHHGKMRWRAALSINGKQKTLGHKDCPKEAYALYCAAALKYKGEFARLD